jgi:hypothetical protein
MTTPAAATSIRHQVVVDAPIEHAFSVFTQGFGSFKPPEHRNLDRHGDGWESVREGVDAEQGWPLYLHRFAEVVAA